ncbi:MAG: sensor histidine kinase [Chitinophagales bacterium]|nr:sensor histidine kinase [Chitinophagales bacterium]
MVIPTGSCRCIFALILTYVSAALSAAYGANSVCLPLPLSITSSRDTVFDLTPHTAIYDDTFDVHVSYRDIPAVYYKPLSNFLPSRNHRNITKVSHWLKFELSNKTNDTLHAFYYCGKHNLLTLVSESDSILMRGGLADYSDTTSKLFPKYFLAVTINPQETRRFIASPVNYGIVPAAMESKLFVCTQNPRIDKLQEPLYYFWVLLTCIICGGILILGIFNFAQYFTNRKPEYFFYGLYGLAMFLNIERAAEWVFNLRLISQIWPNYFFTSATLLNVCAGIFYLLFTRYFLDLNTKSVAANRVISISMFILIPGTILLVLGVWFRINGNLLLVIFRIFSLLPVFLLLILTLIIYVTLRNSSPLLGYYYVGFILLFIGVSINVFINNFARHLVTEKLPAVFTVEIGVLLEMILFALGLGYKARLNEKQKIEAELEYLKLQHQNEINLLQMRSRLSRDLHDDIGSTLSSINILSRTAQSNLKQGNDDKARTSLEKINERSQRLLDNMGDIIWNVNPDNDTIEEVMSRMREYGTAILEAKNIDYIFNFPADIVDCKLTMQVKSNLYLIFKEAVNNLSKYSGCTRANLSLSFSHSHLHLTIADNGIGFNNPEVKHRGGLANMVHRAEEMKGTISIRSEINMGTTIDLMVPRYC